MSLFFLMCSERSGSNFITKLLNGHKNICGPSTKHLINPVARNIFRYSDLTQEKNWNELLNDIHRLISIDFSIWKKDFSLQDLKMLAPTGDLKSLIHNIFMEEARSHGKQHVFIKENHLYEFLPFLLCHFPESKFVYQTRDPRDMALSWKKNLDHPGGIVKAAQQWRHDQQQNLKNHFLLKEKKKSHLVRYEDLIKNSQEEINDIIDFLGLPHDKNITKFHLDITTQENANSHKAWSNLSKPIMRHNSSKYLNELTDNEILIIESICQNEMKHLGYTLKTTNNARDEVTKEYIEEFSRKEEAKLDYKPSDGVLKNMAAKKIFYFR